MCTDKVKILFALLRSAIGGRLFTEQEFSIYSDQTLGELFALAKKHDVAHLFSIGLKNNSIKPNEEKEIFNETMLAVYRYERLNHDYTALCNALEASQIPILPLKGAVIREFYPEPWMRTSCDMDILVYRDDLEMAIACLVEKLHYEEKSRGPHDVSLFSEQGMHIELHFDLVEEGRANDANDILKDVWNNVSLKNGYNYHYEMSDEFFYYYHIAHMAKHFECGGCGIRPLIDLWILENLNGVDKNKRDKLLENGGLLKFTEACRNLICVWFEDGELDGVSQKMQSYILSGGVYGSSQNRVAIQQRKNGGRIGYLFSRIFIPYSKLKRYYPILEKHKWLMPIMQVRRWFMLLKPDVAKMAKNELKANKNLSKSTAEEMKEFLEEIGIK